MAANPNTPANSQAPANRRPPPQAPPLRDLGHEAHNASQDDESDQAQWVAGEALRHGFDSGGSERVPSGGFDEEGGSTPDLVDHMKQMVTDGRIDMSAYRGERMDDDVEEGLGPQGLEDDGPRGAE